MADAGPEESRVLKCSIKGCPGEYEPQTIVHPVTRKGAIAVIDRVPAEICPVCGDVLLAPDTIRRIERMLEEVSEPSGTVPLFVFA